MEFLTPHRRLWPTDEPGPRSRRFTLIGNPARSQMMVPTANGAAAAESFIRHNAGMGIAERSARRVTWIVTRLGLLGAISRERREVNLVGDNGGPGLDDIVKEATGLTDFELSVSFGPERANRKPVFRIMTNHGRTVAFAKLGWDPLTNVLVQREFETLSLPSIRGLGDVATPTPRYIGEWRSFRIALYDAVVGRPGRVRPGNMTFRKVAHCWPAQTSILAESRFASELRASAERVEEPSGSLARNVISMLIERFGDQQLEFAGWHGDWAPWNSARHLNGGIVLWDWERSGLPAPIGLDAIHFQFQPRVHRVEHQLEPLLEASLTGLASNPQRRVLGYLYVATISLRHLQPDASGGPRALATRHLGELKDLILARR